MAALVKLDAVVDDEKFEFIDFEGSALAKQRDDGTELDNPAPCIFDSVEPDDQELDEMCDAFVASTGIIPITVRMLVEDLTPLSHIMRLPMSVVTFSIRMQRLGALLMHHTLMNNAYAQPWLRMFNGWTIARSRPAMGTLGLTGSNFAPILTPEGKPSGEGYVPVTRIVLFARSEGMEVLGSLPFLVKRVSATAQLPIDLSRDGQTITMPHGPMFIFLWLVSVCRAFSMRVTISDIYLAYAALRRDGLPITIGQCESGHHHLHADDHRFTLQLDALMNGGVEAYLGREPGFVPISQQSFRSLICATAIAFERYAMDYEGIKEIYHDYVGCRRGTDFTRMKQNGPSLLALVSCFTGKEPSLMTLTALFRVLLWPVISDIETVEFEIDLPDLDIYVDTREGLDFLKKHA